MVVTHSTGGVRSVISVCTNLYCPGVPGAKINSETRMDTGFWVGRHLLVKALARGLQEERKRVFQFSGFLVPPRVCACVDKPW